MSGIPNHSLHSLITSTYLEHICTSCTVRCTVQLDVPQRILHKLGVTVHRCLQGKAPQYLVNCCHPTSDVASRQRLRSSSRHHLVVPRHRRTLGRRAFSVAVRWPGMLCLTTSETRRGVAQCKTLKDASVSECTWTLSALEALRNALYKFKTYLLT